MKQFNNDLRGFTLVEIMIAIFVTVVGVMGIYSLLVRAMKVSTDNVNRFTAAQLAKEGVELVRNIRDMNILADNNWDAGLLACSVIGCEIDYNDPALLPFAGRRFWLDNNGFYSYDNPVKQTSFQRKIVITPQADFLDIMVEVTWQSNNPPFRVYEQLYNWRK